MGTAPLAEASRLVPGAAALAVGVLGTWALVSAGSEVGDVVRYLLVWVLAVIVPGVLLWRGLAGHSRIETELGAGSVTGIALLLLSWMLATAVGVPPLAAVGPAVVLVAFLAHPGLRRHWRPRRTDGGRTRPAWWLAMAALSGLAVYRVSLTVLQVSALPPRTSLLASDTWFSLGVAQQLTQGFPVADPSFVGGQIQYHWFSLAVVAATAQLAGTDLPATLIHLWFVPFVVVWLTVVSAVVRAVLAPYEARRRPVRWEGWGPVAAALVVVFPAALILGDAPAVALQNGLNSSSASGAFGGLFVSGLAIPVIGLVRGTARRGTWVVLVLLVAAGSGMKPTVLPVVAAGAGLVVLVALLRRDRAWRPAVLVGLLCTVVFAVAGRYVIGSTAGAKIQPFAMVVGDPGYSALFRPDPAPLAGGGGFLLPAFEQGRPGAGWFVLGAVTLFVLGQLLRLLGVLTLPWSPLRSDSAAWWLAGVVIAGYLVTFLLSHSGFSQQWFAFNVSGVSVALTTAAVALAWPERTRRGTAVPAAATVVLGVVLGALLPVLAAPLTEAGQRPGMGVRLLPYAVVLVAALVWLGLTRRWRRGAGAAEPRGAGAAEPPGAGTADRLAAVAVVALLLTGAALPTASAWLRAGVPVPITRSPGAVVTEDEQAAALWLHRHSAPSDVVLTNVFCGPVRYRPDCDHSAVWLSALSGRRLVLGGWAYIPATAAAYDATRSVRRLPSPFPDRLQLSLDVVQRPTEGSVCTAVSRFGARWIYADRRATPVSAALTDYADVRFANDTVTVYEIRTTGLRCA